ncbi:MAG: hypothetical protein ICV72_14220 [Aldersonia sp.]|nr:hypothetical protein [Aldersonia sp.]
MIDADPPNAVQGAPGGVWWPTAVSGPSTAVVVAVPWWEFAALISGYAASRR